MASILVINASGPETRVALVENGSISEFYLERKKDKGIVGNVYKGKVVRVLPGMQAAFVDIGLEKAAFLYVGDVAGGPDFSEEFDLAETPEGEHGEPPAGEVPAEDTADRANGAAAPAPQPDATPAAVAAPADAGADEPAAPEAGAGPAETAEVLESTGESDESEDDQAEGDEAPEAAGDASAEPATDAEAPAPQTVGTAPEGASEGFPESRTSKAESRPLARRRRRAGAEASDRGARERETAAARGRANIQDLLKEGQEVIVQVVKDPIGTKGARVTCHVSLPGRHLVFMPTVDHVGISRRIESEKERRRLRELVDGLRPAGTGFIVRTVAEGVSREKLVADIKFLLGLWNEMARKKDRLRPPALLHPDLDLILRSIRDLFSAEVEKLVIDDPAEYERIGQFVDQSVPNLRQAIELYRGQEPIFDAYGIEQELTRALGRKVWLKSGGYLVIDQAEALVAIDVNSGRFVGRKNLEETITQINCEAAKEVVYQLRLRNIGGIIIIDFIDMEKAANREKVFKALQDALQRDRAKTNIIKISELGLVEMTRKRVRESVGRLLHEACPHCDGKGHIKSRTTVAYEIFREIQREAPSRREDTLVVNCDPEVAAHVGREERESLRGLMMRYNKTIQLKPQAGYHQEQFDIVARWSRREDKPAPRPAAAQAEGAAPQEAPAAAAEAPEPTGVAPSGAAPAPAAASGSAAPPAAAPGGAGGPGTGNRRRRRRRRGGRSGQAPAPAADASGGAPSPAK